MPRATLRQLAEPNRGVLVHFGCSPRVSIQQPDGFWAEAHFLKRHHGWTLGATEALARWGPATTLEDLERRAVCSICGARTSRARVSLHVPTDPHLIAGRTH